jgi:AcrR family transcriptional regulator
MTGKRERKRGERVEALLGASLRLIERDGLAGLTVQGLSRELDIAVGALYRYFPGKQALLVALQRQALAKLSAQLAAEVERSRARVANADRRDRKAAALAHLVAAMGAIHAFARRDPVRHRLLDELLSAPDPLLSVEDLREVNLALSPLLDQVTSLFHEATHAGALSPGLPELRTRLVWAALHGLDHFRKRDRAERPHARVEQLFPELVRTLLLGFGASKKAVEAAMRWLGAPSS